MAKDADLREVHPYYEMEIPDDCKAITRIHYRCKKCDTKTSQRYCDLKVGRIRCRCNKKYTPSKEERIEQIERKCKEKGYTFNGSVNGKYTFDGRLSITCNKHNHTWEPTVEKFIRKDRGCPVCGGSQPVTLEQFINKSKEVHKGMYSYDKVKDFKNTKEKIDIYCNQHQGYFKQAVGLHMSGQGCSSCSAINSWGSRSAKVTEEDYIERVTKVHGSKYNLSKLNFKTMTGFITFGCEHGWKKIRAKDFANGQGCRECKGYSKGILNKTLVERNKQDYLKKDAIVYFLKMKEGLYKVGISINFKNRLIELRSESKLEPEVVYLKDLNLYNAYYLEDKILSAYESRRVRRGFFEKEFGGWTECMEIQEQDKVFDIIKIMEEF